MDNSHQTVMKQLTGVNSIINRLACMHRFHKEMTEPNEGVGTHTCFRIRLQGPTTAWSFVLVHMYDD